MGAKRLVCLHWNTGRLRQALGLARQEEKLEDDGASQVSRRQPIPVFHFHIPVFHFERLNISQTSFEQSGAVSRSLLFKCLPLELRRLIYTSVFGDRVLHLVRAGEYVGHRTVIKQSATRKLFSGCRWVSPHAPTRGFDIVDLRLLRTCRQIYIEAISILFSTNIFDIQDFSVLVKLDDWYWPPQRVSLIRHLRIVCDPHEEFVEWVRFWDSVVTRMRLTSLNLVLWMGTSKMNDQMLRPTLEVRGIKQVEIRLLCQTSHWNARVVATEMEQRMMRST